VKEMLMFPGLSESLWRNKVPSSHSKSQLRDGRDALRASKSLHVPEMTQVSYDVSFAH
jgi:hypothetical protein